MAVSDNLKSITARRDHRMAKLYKPYHGSLHMTEYYLSLSAPPVPLTDVKDQPYYCVERDSAHRVVLREKISPLGTLEERRVYEHTRSKRTATVVRRTYGPNLSYRGSSIFFRSPHERRIIRTDGMNRIIRITTDVGVLVRNDEPRP